MTQPEIPATVNDLQYLYCAVCLECQDLLREKGKEAQVAITIVNGHAVCEEHRRRASYSLGQVVTGARKYLQEGPRQRNNYGARR